MAGVDAHYEFRSVRTLRGREARTLAKRRSEGWELVARSKVRFLRTEMTFGRMETTPPRRRTPRAILLLVVVLGLVAGTAVGLTLISHDRAMREVVDPNRDADLDGITDQNESSGWRTQRGVFYRTDPSNADTDGDGLSDGEEAGAPVTDPEISKVYLGVSNPGEPDTDGDGVEDGDEYFLDMSPGLRDTDADGLLDNLELQFGSDPTLANPDDDSYNDREEYERGSDPLAFDLSHEEAIAAAKAGALYGDWEWGAVHLGRMREEQLQSIEYIAGQVASGVVGIGDIRDLIANIGKGEFILAAVAAGGLVPVLGDSAKTTAQLTKFAARGGLAERSAHRFIERMPWSESTKSKVLAKVFGSGKVLPKLLRGGPKENVVYVGRSANGSIIYAGITSDFAQRQAQHGGRFTMEPITGAVKLERGEARAIEEALIKRGGFKVTGGKLTNKIHSIDPNLDYYDDAVAWGEKWLVGHGIAGP